MHLEDYLPQGPLAVNEAKAILAVLKEENIRFKFDLDQSCSETDDGSFADSRVDLYVHSEDLARWLELRDGRWKA